MSAQLSYKVGQKVIKTSGRWIGAEVTIKAVFPDISEILVENYDGQVERVTIWDVHRPFAGFPPSFSGHRDAFEKELDSIVAMAASDISHSRAKNVLKTEKNGVL